MENHSQFIGQLVSDRHPLPHDAQLPPIGDPCNLYALAMSLFERIKFVQSMLQKRSAR